MESKNGGACGKGENKTEVLDFLAGTILSQNTTDVNSHRAFNSLKAAFPTWVSEFRPCNWERRGLLSGITYRMMY